ncbi:sensor domain-containing diguanylate cyclase [Treponema zioleckii]|uniref:sensor domain-containing diguanylate cyclase n=1 Tax=Treponema zioleckii TaxID=331680 RepID=UPI00168AADEC|nr:diguanylate cyclase [Treponema zioleckii]
MKKKDFGKIPSLIGIFILIIFSLFFYTVLARNIFLKHALQSIRQNTGLVSVQLDEFFSANLKSISMLAGFLVDALENPESLTKEKLAEIEEDTNFDYIEIFDLEGKNIQTSENHHYTETAESYDFFENALSGHEGIWINYYPRFTDDVLLNFYMPIKKNGKIAGVLNGVVNAKNLNQFLTLNFSNQKILELICDSNLKIITSNSESFQPGTLLANYSDSRIVELLIEKWNKNDDLAFAFRQWLSKGAACVSAANEFDLHVIQIASPKNVNNYMQDITIKTLIVILFIILLLVAYIFYIMQKNKRKSLLSETSRRNLMNALSANFENLFVVNLKTREVSVFILDEEISKKYTELFKTVDYDTGIAQYIKNEVYGPDAHLWENIETIESAFRFFAEKSEYTFIYRVLRDGQLHYFQCSLFKQSKNISEFIVIIKNVDQMILTINEKTEFQSLHEIMRSGQCSFDFDNGNNLVECKWSDPFRRLLGYSGVTDFPNFFESWTNLIHEEDKSAVLKAFWRFVRSGSSAQLFEAECRILTKERGYRWFHFAGRISGRENGFFKHCLGVFVDIDDQRRQMKNLYAIAKIYHTMYSVDLETFKITELSSIELLKNLVDLDSPADVQFRKLIPEFFVPSEVARLMKFVDLTTLAKRMRDKRTIFGEFIGKIHGWIRASFIAVDWDDEGNPKNVIFATEVIDNEKRKEEKLVNSANTDELTGLENRRAYDLKINNLAESPLGDDFVYVSIDVNGLKNINDTYGHSAGDELIIGAADCLKKAFGDYGNVYRVGGDEFQAVLNADGETLSKIKENLETLVQNWKGDFVESLSISCGYVSKTDVEEKLSELSISEIAKLADRLMYRNKAEYYANKGIDRRGLGEAFNAISKSYLKILKIHLANDMFNVLKVDEHEKNAECGYDERLSVWLKGFVDAGFVEDKFVDEFLRRTASRNLLDYLKVHDTFTFRYGRKLNSKYQPVFMEVIKAPEFSEEKPVCFLMVKKDF